MTDATQALVWDAVYTPFGATTSITGAASNDLRFPGNISLSNLAFINVRQRAWLGRGQTFTKGRSSFDIVGASVHERSESSLTQDYRDIAASPPAAVITKRKSQLDGGL